MVIHYLKDGTRLEDISGHIVKMADAEIVYKLMDTMNLRGGRDYEERKTIEN